VSQPIDPESAALKALDKALTRLRMFGSLNKADTELVEEMFVVLARDELGLTEREPDRVTAVASVKKGRFSVRVLLDGKSLDDGFQRRLAARLTGGDRGDAS
jgi:hypothetical protein